MPPPGLIFGVIPLGFEAAKIALSGIKDEYPKAVTDAINRSLLAGRTAAAKSISARYAITSAAVKENFTIKNASWTKLHGELIARGPMLPVTTFKVFVKKIKVRGQLPPRDSVSVTVLRGQKKPIAGAFRLPDGRIMERRQPSKFPIFPVSTIGASHMAGQADTSKLIQEAMNEQYATRLEHNVDRALTALKEKAINLKVKAKAQITAKETEVRQ